MLYLPGNTLGMIGVSSGIAVTLGMLKPSMEVLAQMGGAMGSGKVMGCVIGGLIQVPFVC